FDDNGFLPPGIHVCSLEELDVRFGHGSPEREVELNELRDFIHWCHKAGIARVIVNGSFVTAKVSPIDVDIVVCVGADYPRGQNKLWQDETRWPFLQIVVAADDDDFAAWTNHIFADNGRHGKKGMVEVRL
ncbi:MAG TPA: hypothetical protein VK137_13155, partial [Planctomycetaceae bacterium]|nr:hypothetical protein [Planctomycetaceae bacterium]